MEDRSVMVESPDSSSHDRRNPRGFSIAWFLVAGLVGSVAPAGASDGIAEINHACAIANGCFSGDSGGYPVTIDGSAGGSYRLTSNLVVPNANTDGIKLSAASVTIDLNGFHITRSGCESGPLFCSIVAGTGSGIELSGSGDRGTAVRNGTIVGMGRNGVNLGDQADVSDLVVWSSGSDGILVRWAAIVEDCFVAYNGGTGIVALEGSLVRGNTARENSGDGISALFGSVIAENVVVDNTAGITSGDDSLAIGNAAYDNSLYGIRFTDTTSGFTENVVRTGPVAPGGTTQRGVDLGGNACDGGSTCP